MQDTKKGELISKKFMTSNSSSGQVHVKGSNKENEFSHYQVDVVT